MSNPNFDNLPPEMQARIASIIAAGKQNPPAESPHQAAMTPAAPAAPTPPAPVAAPPKPPNLMDHVIMLRQEVAEMRNQLAAVAQVTDAVGQAVGQMYAMFQSQTEPTSYSANFQAQTQEVDEDY